MDAFLGVEHSASGRRWVARPCDDRTALGIAQKLGVPEVLGRVLASRGVSMDGALGYLNPRVRDLLPDPSQLADMDRAAERLARAVRDREGIAVFGDYDVDGATSSALLQRFFRGAGAEVKVYIPDRMREGYGPNAAAMLKLGAEGARVIVTVDCGTMAFTPLAAAADAGIDVVVVDHHVAGPELPRAYAVVNPNRLDESGVHGALAAVGVAFLLTVAVNRELRRTNWYGAGRTEPNLMQMLDLVALGTVCDVVPLTGVNRALVAQGLKVMAQRRNAGLAALADVARVDSAPSAYHTGFLLGPRVNAGGRVGRSDLGARLLATDDVVEAHALAAELDRYNGDRKTIEAQVHRDAMELVERRGDPGPLVFVDGDGWHPGVIGIVASRLTEAYHRPSVVVAIEGGIGKGSCRSVPGVDIGAAVIAAQQAGLLMNGGGHRMAAGFTVGADKVDALGAFLRDRVAAARLSTPAVHDFPLDGAINATAANTELIERLEAAGPFGAGNAEPRFAVAAAEIVKVDVVGESHVRALVGGGDGKGRLKAMAFRSLDGPVGAALMAGRGTRMHLAGTLRADTWQGQTRAQLIVEDVAPA